MQEEEGGGGDLLKVTQTSWPFLETLKGPFKFTFTPDSTTLIIHSWSSTKLYFIDLSRTDQQGAAPEYKTLDFFHHGEKVTCMAVSDDSKYLVCSSTPSSTCFSTRLVSFDLENGGGGGQRHHATLPTTSSHTTDMAFITSTSTLIVNTASNKVVLLDVCTNTSSTSVVTNNLHIWSRETIRGVVQVGGGKRVGVWANNFMVFVDLDKKVLEGERGARYSMKRKITESTHELVTDSKITESAHEPVTDSTTQEQLQQLQEEEDEQVLRLDHRYQSIMFCSALNQSEMVIVERPVLAILSQLPHAFKLEKFYT